MVSLCEPSGTAEVARPTVLGVWARFESARSNAVGYANPVFYPHNGTSAFHDVTLGDTGPYPATPGDDLATGLGTFDVAAFIGAGG